MKEKVSLEKQSIEMNLESVNNSYPFTTITYIKKKSSAILNRRQKPICISAYFETCLNSRK